MKNFFKIIIVLSIIFVAIVTSYFQYINRYDPQLINENENLSDRLKKMNDTLRMYEYSYHQETRNVISTEYYGKYMIIFKYDTMMYTQPLTFPIGVKHYASDIIIYDVSRLYPILIKWIPDGQYTKHLCDLGEDDLRNIIKEIKIPLK